MHANADGPATDTEFRSRRTGARRVRQGHRPTFPEHALTSQAVSGPTSRAAAVLLSNNVMRPPRADLTPGSPADFVLLRGECLPQVVVDMPARDMVVHTGQVVARDGRLI